MKSFEEVTHAEMVEILAKDGQQIVDEMTPEKANLLHMSACVMEEVGELQLAVNNIDKENILEELGDIAFYLRGIANSFNFNPSIDVSKILNIDINTLSLLSAQLYSTIKPYLFYNKEIDILSASTDLNRVYSYFVAVVYSLKYSIVEVEEANKKKLSKRYHKLSFSNEQAQDRADK